MPVSDVARRDVVTAHPDQTAGNLATVMVEEDVGSVVIVNDARPIGIVTDRDLVREVLEPRLPPQEVFADEIMTETPFTVGTDAGLFDAMVTMNEHLVRRLPVVDRTDAIAGILTLDDLVVLLAEELDGLADVVRAESPPYERSRRTDRPSRVTLSF